MNTENGFEQREHVSTTYWKDPIWNEIKKLRKEHQNLKANGLVMMVRAKYGL